MSRIGNLPIDIPAGVEVSIDSKNNLTNVTIKGPLGVLEQVVCQGISISVENKKIILAIEDDKQTSYNKSAMHGLYRMLIHNMVIGVSKGFSKTLELIGVGYKAALIKDGILDFDLGFSHKVYFALPAAITAEVVVEKGKNIMITLKGCDKQLVGLVSAKIRSLRKVEPYKGKGFRYQNEVVKLKVGKTATK